MSPRPSSSSAESRPSSAALAVAGARANAAAGGADGAGVSTGSGGRSGPTGEEGGDGPPPRVIFASHNNCRALVPQQRQFANDQLQTIIDRDGVVGAAFHCWMLKPGWTRQDGNKGVALATVADHIDHICQLAGNSRHAAIGSDLDGGFGQEQSPADLDTIADLQKVVGILEDRGHASEDIANIMHGNWERLFLRVLP